MPLKLTFFFNFARCDVGPAALQVAQSHAKERPLCVIVGMIGSELTAPTLTVVVRCALSLSSFASLSKGPGKAEAKLGWSSRCSPTSTLLHLEIHN